MPSDLTFPADWRERLEKWLVRNPKTMPDRLRQLHMEFLERFPREKIATMSLDEYALGHKNSKDSFCYWLEFRLDELGSVRGGSSAKWGVWWSAELNDWRFNKGYSDPDSAIQSIRTNLDRLLTAAAERRYDELDEIGSGLGVNRNSLRAKTVYLYFPDEFLPINSRVHLDAFIRIFGLNLQGGTHARNRHLLMHLRSFPEFAGFDTLQMMLFLYELLGNQLLTSNFGNDAFRERLQQFVVFANSDAYAAEERGYKSQTLETLGEALRDEHLRDANAAAIVYSAWKKELKWIANLTHWSDSADFGTFLQSEEGTTRTAELLRELFDEEANLADRIDRFKAQIDDVYKRIFAGGERSPTLSLGVISVLLAGRNPNKYMVYRSTSIERACSDWGLAKPTGSPGTIYGKAMAVAASIETELDKALPGGADYVDVHSFLWFNLKFDAYYKAKLDTKEIVGPGINVPKVEVPDIPSVLLPLWQAVSRSRNLILQGPPGTGKTYLVNHFTNYYLLWHNVSPQVADEYWQSTLEQDKDTVARLRAKVSEQRAFVTFHQSYAYEEFVEGLRPVVDSNGNGQLGFKVTPGIFLLFCQHAQSAWQTNPTRPPHYVLVIDEINRGNIAKIFGELITLLEDDKRLGESNEIRVTLPYSGDNFAVPPNLVLLGTMNTADRSIALLDIALRRRFTFIEQMPDPSQLGTVEGIPLSKILDLLNQKLCRYIDRDHQIGHSYLMEVNSLRELEFAWYQRIIPLLQEYFYNDTSRLLDVLTSAFVRPQEASARSVSDGATYNLENNYVVIPRLVGDEFRQAMLAFLDQ
jgi:hypothetical protein